MAKGVNPHALGLTLVAVAFALDISGYVWHGLLGQPSLINLLYRGFWSNPALMFYGLVASVASAYLAGFLAAYVYNWAEKKYN